MNETHTMKAKELKPGQKLNLWHKGQMQVVTIARLWVTRMSVYVDYTDGSKDLFRPWDDLTQQIA
jgi:hypothetical protein